MSEKKPEHGPEKKHEKKFDKKPVEAKPGSLGTEIIVAIIIAVIVLPLLGAFYSEDLRLEVLALIATPLAYIKMFATVVTMVALFISIYAFLRTHEIAGEETKKLGLTLSWEHERTEKNERWERVENYMRSDNPSDWKMAILEADNILDDVVERMGYRGETLGERMKMIEASDFPYLEDAWKAHKLRNEIAHKAGADFVLSRATVEQTVNIYHRIFKELGYL